MHVHFINVPFLVRSPHQMPPTPSGPWACSFVRSFILSFIHQIFLRLTMPLAVFQTQGTPRRVQLRGSTERFKFGIEHMLRFRLGFATFFQPGDLSKLLYLSET